MADGHGGKRTPDHPAVVSGPGAHSRRTDGGPGAKQVLSAAPDQEYGAMTQQLNDQRTAPMAGATPLPPAAPVPTGQGAPAQGPAFSGSGFADPSTRPNEPVTQGADAGPGAGPEAMSFAPPTGAAGMGPTTGAMTRMLQGLAATDSTGVLAALLQNAQARGV